MSDEDIAALHLLRMVEGKECAPLPVNPAKVAQKLLAAREHNDRHFMLMAVLNGKLVGHLLIERVEAHYSDVEFLTDFGFYVLPQHRNSDVGQALLEEARRISTLADLPLFIFLTNPNRPRGSRHSMEKVASIIRYVPAGAVLAFNAKDQESVLR